MLLHGKPVDVSTIPKAMDAGLAYATEDRKTYGLVLIDHIKHNVTLANLDGVSGRGVIDDMQELTVANKYRKDLAHSLVPASSRRLSIFRAATSRRSCCRSGCSPAPRS